MSTKFSSRENVKVVIRYRPVNKVERAHENEEVKSEPMSWDEKAQNIILGKKKNKIWGFDGVCGPEVDQEKMFTIVAEQTCRDVVNGYNGTIFVYGQTGSGKTYTMYGAEDKPHEISLMGVIPRSVSYIFDTIQHEEDIETYRVTVSFLEIYQEKLRDLLNEDKHQDLKIRLNKRHETYVQGLVEHQVESISDVLQLISIAVGNRVTDSTNMNAVSSRSHMLMRMTVVIKLKDGTIRIAAANFADLAGSEKVKKTGARGQRLNEAKAINKSLSILGQVINALSSGKNKHVPFRDSMLTHVLRDSLGGNCKTTLVVTTSPHKYNRMETINSLRFGRRCKLVTNKASVNRVYSNDELMRRLAMLEAKNEELQEMLKQKAFEAFQNSHVPKQIEGLQKELDQLREKLSKTEAENDDLDKIIVGLRNEKLELEDKSATDKEQIETLQNRIGELEGVITELKEELEGYKQRERQLNNAQKLLEDKLKTMEGENEERSTEISNLQNELRELRQFKHETQQQNIQNMMKQEEQNTEMNQLKQQIETQQLEFEQQIISQQIETNTVRKELEIEKEKVTKLMAEQEKIDKEEEYQIHRRYSAANAAAARRKTSNVQAASGNDAAAEEEEKGVIDDEELEKEIETLAKNQQERLQQYEEKLREEYEAKQAELINREEMIKNEMKQKLMIQIKSETDEEFNKKMRQSQEQFAAQLVRLQDALTDAHNTSNTMRMEVEEERKKYRDLQNRDNEKSKCMMQMENEKESMMTEVEELRKQLAEERKRSANMSNMEDEHKGEIERYEEEKDCLLKEREDLQQQLDEERSKIDQIRSDFQRKAELFGAKEKQHLNLLKKSHQEKEAIANQLSQHSKVLAKSNELLNKQNAILRQRESKIYTLVEKQTQYLDSMNQLRTIQIGMDEDVAKRMLDEEAEAEKRRKKQLEEQRRKDEEFVRSLLLQERKPDAPSPPAVDVNEAADAPPSPQLRGSSQSVIQHRHSAMVPQRMKSNKSHSNKKRKHVPHVTDVEEMMKFANAQSKTNLSQQIASVALAQQRDRLKGGKQKKSVLDLWIKSQMQLMCGQLPTLCKKYGIQLHKLDDMYGNAKRNYQPKFDELHYLKFRDANFDPKEFDAERIKMAAQQKKRHSKLNQNEKKNPLLAANGAASGDKYDPYGHYNRDDVKQRIAPKPRGFVAQPQSPSLNVLQSPSMSSKSLEDENLSPNRKKKSKGIGGIFKKRKSKRKSSKKQKNQKEKKEYTDFEFEVEDAPPPVPFGQYLNNMDLQQFEKIKIANGGKIPPHLMNPQQEKENVELQLEEDRNNMDRYRYPAKREESQSSNESLELAANGATRHQLAPTQGTVLVHDLASNKSYSAASISTMQQDEIQMPHQLQLQFEAVTEMKRIGEMAGIVVQSQFGLVNNKKNAASASLRLTIKNGNLNGSAISKLNLKFSKNCCGIASTLSALHLSNGAIAHKQVFECNVPLILREEYCRNDGANFDYSAQLILNTNLFAIKCVIRVPIHLFFQSKGQLPRDQFLAMWKSISSEKESKVQIRRARSDDMEHLKSLLQIHKLFFIHHRTIASKGNILYYSAKMYGQVLLCEISIALSGKGTCVVRSADRYKSMLCVHAVKMIIDASSS